MTHLFLGVDRALPLLQEAATQRYGAGRGTGPSEALP